MSKNEVKDVIRHGTSEYFHYTIHCTARAFLQEVYALENK